MKTKICLISFLLLLFFQSYAVAQINISIKGRITDVGTGEPIAGVHVVVKENTYGVISDNDGRFLLKTQLAPPLVLHLSHVSYESLEFHVAGTEVELKIQMKEQAFLGQEVVVSSSRIEENILQSAVSVEKMNLRDIQMGPSSSFYDGLYQLKGVDMNVHGLTFQLPNTRGFNDYTNYRFNQIVDGMENIAPGLSFAAGNIFGLSQLDVANVELVVGASSVLYGPGGMNGTLVMQSKDPFRYQGAAVSAQLGMMNLGSSSLNQPSPLYDVSFRFAKAFSKRVAFKVTGTFFQATDWQANDFRDRSDLNNPQLTRFTNPGYDGVNSYGDESLVSVNLSRVANQVIDGIAQAQGISQGNPEYDALYQNAIRYFPNQLVTRTGWSEKALADDKTQNVRIGGALHYFFTERTELVAQSGFAQGSSVYTAQNRFAARDFSIVNAKLELNNPNYYVRAWGVAERSGSSYDIGAAALRLNEAWKPSESWFADYLSAYTQTALLTQNMDEAHRFARLVADNRDPLYGTVFDQSKPAFPVAGSGEFKKLLNNITSRSVSDGGAQVMDHSKMMQVEGMYNFTHLIGFIEVQLGVSHRIYSINSKGTIFFDEPGNPIQINQFGTFLQANKNFFSDRLRITGAFRYDKNQYFKAQYTPRFSAVYFVDQKKQHSLRGTLQTAYRFPSVADQWVDLNAGVFQTVGGMPAVKEKYGFYTIPLYPLSGRNPIIDKPVTENGPILLPELQPEKVASAEVGYKGLLLNKKLFLDTYVYYNRYKGFEAIQLVAQLAEDTGSDKDQYFQTFFTTDEPISSLGYAVGADYLTSLGFLIRSNMAYNRLLESIDSPGVEARYNTPEYRVNLSVGHMAILPNLGFNVNMHWQSKFVWEGGFGKGVIPANTTLDAQITYRIQPMHTILKIGGSNILNNYYTTSFGSAQIGGLYYMSLVFDSLIGRTFSRQ